MYVIKVLHGYITPKATRSLQMDHAKKYSDKQKAVQIAYLCGGRLEKVE